MSGYKSILMLRHLEKEVDQLGFVLEAPKSSGWGDADFDDRVSIIPKDENALPIYSRDAEIFTGTLENLRIWLQGVRWARQYDSMLGLSNEKKRTKKEDEHRHREMLRKLAQDHTNEKAV